MAACEDGRAHTTRGPKTGRDHAGKQVRVGRQDDMNFFASEAFYMEDWSIGSSRHVTQVDCRFVGIGIPQFGCHSADAYPAALADESRF